MRHLQATCHSSCGVGVAACFSAWHSFPPGCYLAASLPTHATPGGPLVVRP